jgi:hypothetical protein
VARLAARRLVVLTEYELHSRLAECLPTRLSLGSKEVVHLDRRRNASDPALYRFPLCPPRPPRRTGLEPPDARRTRPIAIEQRYSSHLHSVRLGVLALLGPSGLCSQRFLSRARRLSQRVR